MREKLLVSFVLTMLLLVVVSPIGVSVGVVDFDALYLPTSTQDMQSQAVSVGPGVETLWRVLPEETVSAMQGDREPSMEYEIDVTVLQELKSQPFRASDNLPAIEEDPAVSTLESEPSAPSLLRDFEGLDDLNQPHGWLHRPPDPHIAVGLNHVGVMVNSELAFYTKNGTLVTETSFFDWWSDVYPGPEFGKLFDPRIAYDHHADRWLMMALGKNSTLRESYYLLSVSQTSDPTSAWWSWTLNGSLMYNAEDTWADYPDLGFDGISPEAGGAIYITSNQFTWANSFKTSMLNILPKSALYNGNGFSYWRVWGRTNEDGSQAFTLRTAHTFGNPSREFLINSKSGGWDKVTLWYVVPTFPPTPVNWVRQATITIGTYSPPPDAQQKGGTAVLDTVDNRIYNCMYRNGHLYAAFTEAYDWGSGTVAAIRYLKIDTSSNSADLNVIYGADGYYYFFPAIYSDLSDNILIVFARSSATEYAGIRYTGRKTTDNATQASAQLKAGETYITGFRWGDYFGIATDPVRGNRVWVYGEWAKDCPGVFSDWDWGTWIGEVTSVTFDVAVTNITLPKTVVCQGYSTSINVTVENQGDFPETFNVTTHYDDTPIETKTVTNLPPREETTISFTWNTTGIAKGNYTVSANATIVLGETDTTDNSYTDGTVRVNMAGDVKELFGIVNIVDIVYVAIHFGAKRGEPEYESNADINDDGIIDIADVVIVGIHFGETDP